MNVYLNKNRRGKGLTGAKAWKTSEYKELVKKYLASRAILISTAHNESNIIIGRSLRHNETIRVRLTASSSLLRLSVLPLQISLEKIPLRSCNLLFKAEIYKKKKKGKKNI